MFTLGLLFRWANLPAAVPFPLPFNNGTSIYDVCFEGEGLVQEEKKLGRLRDYIIYML